MLVKKNISFKILKPHRFIKVKNKKINYINSININIIHKIFKTEYVEILYLYLIDFHY